MGGKVKWFWGGLAALALVGVFYLNWQSGHSAPSGYLYNMSSSATEAGYCMAVVERVREITHGRSKPKLEAFVDEQISFWRGRVKGAATFGRVALARDSTAPGVNEGAHLHLAIQDCGIRAVAFYGVRFRSME
jgi:hypothetical protein